MKRKEHVIVIRQEEIADDIYSIWLKTEDIARESVPGQFVSVYMDSDSHPLPRPISICEIDREDDAIRLVYRCVGWGTRKLATLYAGKTLEIAGPLGNGFPLCAGDEKALVVGGGIGIPPMLELFKSLECEKLAVLGFKDELFLMDEFQNVGNFYVSTDDGSAGFKGTVVDAITENSLSADVIYACGPHPMLAAVKKYAQENKIKCFVSLEGRMACGIGACLSCVCKSVEKDEHTNVYNKRICACGPVFDASEVEIV